MPETFADDVGRMKQPDDALAVLRRSLLFDRASAEDLAPLLKESRWRKYPVDSYLFLEGDPAVGDIPGRVSRKLLDLAGTQSTFALSQSTLAGLVGASRENVNRAIPRFASLGYISLDGGRITLLRPDELRRRGE